MKKTVWKLGLVLVLLAAVLALGAVTTSAIEATESADSNGESTWTIIRQDIVTGPIALKDDDSGSYYFSGDVNTVLPWGTSAQEKLKFISFSAHTVDLTDPENPVLNGTMWTGCAADHGYFTLRYNLPKGTTSWQFEATLSNDLGVYYAYTTEQETPHPVDDLASYAQLFNYVDDNDGERFRGVISFGAKTSNEICENGGYVHLLFVDYSWWRESVLQEPDYTDDSRGYGPLLAIGKNNPITMKGYRSIEETFEQDDEGLIYTLNAEGTEYSVTGYKGTASEVVIPSAYCGLPVTSIGERAFYNCSSLTSITIPEGVTIIYGYAFCGCSNLKNIHIPSSVSSIKNFVIDGDVPILLPGMSSVGGCILSGCSNLESIEVDADNLIYYSTGNCLIETASKTLIAGCKNSIIPTDGSVTTIGDYAFESRNLTSIAIPNTIVQIGYGAFATTDLVSVVIPENVQYVEDCCFSDCDSLTSIIFLSSTTRITDQWDAGVTIASNATIYGYEGSTAEAYAEKYGRTFVALDEEEEEQGAEGLVYTLNDAGTEYSVTGYEGTDTGVVIPSTYNGKPVTSIGDSSFAWCENLTSITIPNGVTSIGDGAFEYCSGLTNITLPDSITSIGDNTFNYCWRLTSITIPDSVTSIGEFSFKDCKLTSVTIPDSVMSIGDAAFFGNGSLTSITFESSNTEIHDSAYTISDTATIYGYEGSTAQAYAEKYGRTFVALEEEEQGTEGLVYTLNAAGTEYSVTGYEGTATEVIIPNTYKGLPVTSIGDNAFDGCGSLTNVTIPENVTSIGNYAFAYCKSLTNITIPNSVTSIGHWAFYYCSGLTGITIPDSVTSIAEGAFNNCSSLTSITIPNSVTSIGSSAFYDCAGLTSITIPNSVTSIGHSAFYNCISLISITLPFVGETKDGTTNTHFGYIFGANNSNYHFSYLPTALTTVVITGGTSIETFAFESCTGLTSITIPSSVTSIGYSAFGACTSLTNIAFGENSQLTSIGEAAFSHCTGLTSITIPDSVTSIGSRAFYDCSSLTSIAIPDSVTSFGQQAFYDCDVLASITFGENSQLTRIDDYAFVGCYGLTSIIIPDSVTSIGINAFEACSSLTSITIPDGVTSIGESAFASCSGLTSIKFLSSDTEIYDDEYTISDTATIYGYEGSTAQAYAEKYNRTFVALEEDPYTEGLIFTLNAAGTEYSVTGYNGTSNEITIPRTYRGLPVTGFVKGVFATEEQQPDGYIGNGAIIMPDDTLWVPSRIEQITFMSKTIVIEDDADTIPSDVTVCGYINSTAQAYAEKYGREFVILPEIASANIALGSDITVNYLAYLDESQKDAVMKFTVNGVTTEVAGVATATPNRYQFSFTGINPQMMGDNIAVELVLNGETLAEMGAYSVKQYCVNMKARVANKSITGFSDAQYAALDTLLADILEYGAAAQVYNNYKTSALVNAGITGASEFIPLTEEHRRPALEASTVSGYEFIFARVELSHIIYIYFGFTAEDISRVTIKVGDRIYDQDDFDFSATTDGSGTVRYELCSEPIFADQLETSFKIELCVDGEVCQTLRYSVVNYIYKMQDNSDAPDFVELLKRIRNYGLSAVAYRDAK